MTSHASTTDTDRRLPVLLSVIAGMSDVIGYITLGGLFTAHVTGNAVVIAAVLVRGGPIHLSHVLAVPVFMAGVAIVWLVAAMSGKRGPALIASLLWIQLLLLATVLVFSVSLHAADHPHGVAAGIAGLLAIAAMACQAGLSRAAVSGGPTTGPITGNLTISVLSLLDTLLDILPGTETAAREPLLKDARERLRTSLPLVAGFFGGCVAGAAAAWMGDWAWTLPVAVSGACCVRRRR